MFDFDLADRVDDLICIFDNGTPDSDMDTISILLTGWITFLFCSILLVKWIYRKYKNKGHPEPEVEQTPVKLTIPLLNGTPDKLRDNRNEVKAPTKEDPGTKEPDRIPPPTRHQAPLLKCSGPHPVVVDFVNGSQNWLYGDDKRRDRVSSHVNALFLQSLNKVFHGIPHQDAFVATVDDLSLSDDLLLQNLFAEYEDSNRIKITCDCEAKFAGHVSLVPISTENDGRKYEFSVNRLVGRLKFVVNLESKLANFKFDGWPEICLAISNTSKDSRLEPKVSENISSKLSSALRNATVEMDLEEFENFPALPACRPKPKPKVENRFLQIELKQGVDIGLQKDCDRAYCVFELDDAAEKFQSRSKSLPNPIWNESFILNTGSSSDCELLVEVYSTISGTFLGCHIVSVDNIIDGKKESLKLKSRRVKVSENITGAVEVVFTFLDEKEALQAGSSQFNSNSFRNTERLNVRKSSDGERLNTLSSSDSHFARDSPTPPVRPPRATHTAKLEDQYGEERGRRRTRRGDIFTSIRRQFSKERSKSVVTDAGGALDLQNSDFARSVSVDRPGVREVGLGSDSTRSSASELSQYSAHSTATFTHESSTLLIESVENGVKKYYLIPPEQVGTGKWKHKKKLHVFNDHTFVAKRIPSGLSCTVCFGRFQFSLRKQGYQCRDCRLISHKECHIRIPNFCVKSRIYDIDVITV